MAPKCGVCHLQDSKYKCPICELRYCSIPCYKSHKSVHINQASENGISTAEKPQETATDRPKRQKLDKVDFSGFENDTDFQHLLTRFPNLKNQLQLVYGVTLEPGPNETSSWARKNWFKDGHDEQSESNRGGFRDRGRGRGRIRGRGGRYIPDTPSSDNGLHGAWTQEKGNKQAQDIIHAMRSSGKSDLAEGMEEFIQLCHLKFGEKN
ncbi:hypothetical protein M409DRAFT_16824 [Zasmidium cellare ATCC 36951]|uniref:HIT-type domain-containing protein n=1 Tax=Zasmidium cellare ATCC 36951 TaxID=1080233 RepID=A0A6A6D3A3_ZASCE|nr:uncharacterized protein M409DRAFT_16824 [Zasmidium cellare ATCC 36951]KAF2172870.1 hypothetical protein M409DRAFT_16824 [Zasmidium cellare ATCC 36951]